MRHRGLSIYPSLSHPGYFSMLALSLGCSVAAFEPQQRLRPSITRSLQFNSFNLKRFSLLPCALAAEAPGPNECYVARSSTLSRVVALEDITGQGSPNPKRWRISPFLAKAQCICRPYQQRLCCPSRLTCPLKTRIPRVLQGFPAIDRVCRSRALIRSSSRYKRLPTPAH